MLGVCWGCSQTLQLTLFKDLEAMRGAYKGPVLGRIMPPKDACIPIPKPVNMLLYLAKGLRRGDYSMDLEREDDPGLSGWVNVIPQVLARGMQNSQNQTAIS